ncbi:alpha/beta fold hydrolase [Nocardia sp. AG03]|uniref:alpha/beta fold hydrolase n=1 Tax=Nocardia sp. AG03 TaxID=3025312 RepID=UPI0024185663|nr:alpha/beta fold hydrolase [Nocardia sp. AG03]
MPKNPLRATIVAALATASLLAAGFAPATAEAPGSVISVLDEPAGWRGMADGKVIEYWMTDSAGVARPASGAVFVPEGDAPATGWPIIAYDHGTSGSGPGCGGQSDPESMLPRFRGAEDALIKGLVDQGYAVVAPDYLGLGRFDTGPHPYLEVRSEATATIDLVRAARAADLDLSRTWSVFGVSQGGHAALSTAHVQSWYAPELDFRGTVAVDPASDVEKVLPLAGPGLPQIPGLSGATSSFVVSILAGLRATHPEADVDSYLTPLGRSLVDAAGHQCIDKIFAGAQGVNPSDMLAKPLAPLRDVLAEYMTLPTSGYDAPILLTMNVTDMVVPSPLHGALVAQFAANGVDQQVIPGTGEHGTTSPQMRTAIAEFHARVHAAPPQR